MDVHYPVISPNAWDPLPYIKIVPEMFAHLRSEFGYEIELLHDVHSRLTPIQAVGLAKDLEPYKLFFLEDLLAPEDCEWLRWSGRNPPRRWRSANSSPTTPSSYR